MSDPLAVAMLLLQETEGQLVVRQVSLTLTHPPLAPEIVAQWAFEEGETSLCISYSRVLPEAEIRAQIEAGQPLSALPGVLTLYVLESEDVN